MNANKSDGFEFDNGQGFMNAFLEDSANIINPVISEREIDIEAEEQRYFRWIRCLV